MMLGARALLRTSCGAPVLARSLGAGLRFGSLLTPRPVAASTTRNLSLQLEPAVLGAPLGMLAEGAAETAPSPSAAICVFSLDYGGFGSSPKWMPSVIAVLKRAALWDRGWGSLV